MIFVRLGPASGVHFDRTATVHVSADLNIWLEIGMDSPVFWAP